MTVYPLTPASASALPPLGQLVADNPLWRYPTQTPGGQYAAHLRVWLTTGPEPGHLAVVTETGATGSVTASAGHIWAELAGRYGPSLVLLEHCRAAGSADTGESLDLVRVGAGWPPHWTRVWPTPEDSPRHAGLEAWMAAYGCLILGGE